ncbi:hypothetical protein HYX10_02090 [Candidatus Woesearchaeota archaeon]|nr:hypothetical protein [Candidatus Woesearchaeota archaeon]
MKDELYLTALAVYEREESRIDIFLKEVGKMLRFTESMEKRANPYRKAGNLQVFLAANEDIFLLKAMTPRVGDIDDCDRLMQEPLNYDAIYEEAMLQSTPDRKWYFWFYEKLCLIENQNSVAAPIKNQMFREIEKNWKDKPPDFMHEVPNIAKHIPDRKLAEELNNKIAAEKGELQNTSRLNYSKLQK